MSIDDIPIGAVIAVVAVGLVVVAGFGAVAAWQLGAFDAVLGGGGASAGDAIDQVPENVDVVTRTDMAILEDRATNELFSRSAQRVNETVPMAPTNVSQGTDRVENASGIDPKKVDEVVSFSRYNEQGTVDTAYSGTIVHADVTEDEFMEAVRNQSTIEYTRTEIDGKTVYKPESGASQLSTQSQWIAVLNDGEYVVGSENAVRDVIDVVNGDQETFDGTLRDAYDETRNGYVKFAARVPEQQLPSSNPEDSTVDITQYRKVRIVTGVYYTKSNAAGVKMRMIARSDEDAKDVKDVTSGGISFVTGTVQNETVQESFRTMEVTRNGDTVVVSYEEKVGILEQMFAFWEERELEDEETAAA